MGLTRCATFPRVVITGLGIACPLGVGVHYVWDRLLQGDCGITAICDSSYDDIPCKLAGYVPRGTELGQLDFNKEFLKSDLKTLSLASCYGLIAAKEALQDAKWNPSSENEQQETGVAVGMGMVDVSDIILTGKTLEDRGYRYVSPYFVPRILVNMVAGQISIRHKLQGPVHAVSTACTTGLHAIGDAFNFIQRGDASVMVCGGSEAVISPLAVAAFARMRALSTNYNDNPSKASRPFDKKREGFVMSEGAGILILESLEHAEKRDAKIYAEVLGYGLSGDAHHITAPREDGKGAFLCMKSTLRDAELEPSAVQYINAHATSTPLGDAAEVRAIKQLFGNHAKTLAISSTKGAIGHMLGAAGSVEAIFTVLACWSGDIPPTINFEETEEDLNFVPVRSQKWPYLGQGERRVALTNSFGFGGTNASLVIGSFNK
ncbi:3-oxoacyl-[acyl-carrier-protein] synthase, mitochondrial-like [Limulus polyphemus]|uniref:3-oxoacyl-[acyl-carrier-protein] synthase n=1 Tax=Limulus polyphemus TaxID=6850 RepID=A0ABM1BNK3_LIMPO|nr:3-oxoacyl-[acyl-carrier-protein] synthase, mitochondrial-like [Limulus polyphemus]XP_013785597.1 3-oxoacyl-[acyl-carrier-protein] synthase, mitochondrial-like [Limulus polyphemus]